MNLCILCEDSKVVDARKNGTSIMGPNTLKIPLSKTGFAPATHWFCFLTVNQEGFDIITSLPGGNVVFEESAPKAFLEKWNLRVIK